MAGKGSSRKKRTAGPLAGWCAVLLLTLLLTGLWAETEAAEHPVERGETALQIAIDHDLTMDQLSQLNPDADLEMMRVGDVLTVPDEGLSFDEFLDRLYSEVIRFGEPACSTAADHHAVCLFHAENISDAPLYDVQMRIGIRSVNGARGEADGSIPLIQVMPGESLPVFIDVPGGFDGIKEASVKCTGLTRSGVFSSSFRIPESLYTVDTAMMPGGIGSRVTLRFSAEALSSYEKKQINILAASYSADGVLNGVRSMYSDFYPVIELSVYSSGSGTDSVRVWLEAY